jgi:hypothetical protein
VLFSLRHVTAGLFQMIEHHRLVHACTLWQSGSVVSSGSWH